MYQVASATRRVIPVLSSISSRFVTNHGLHQECQEGPLSTYKLYCNQGTLKPDQHQLNAVTQLQSLYERCVGFNSSSGEAGPINEQTTPKGLYLYGGVGTGKTVLMDIFYNSIPTKHKKRVHFNAFMLQLYSEANRWNLCVDDEIATEISPMEFIARRVMQDAWLLCFDEMQFADYASCSLLEGFFKYLFTQGAVVVATSNRPTSELGSSSFTDQSNKKETLAAVTSMLDENCQLVAIESGKDYRTLQQPGQQTYFYPLCQDTEIHLDAAFSTAVGPGMKICREHLNVYGRKVIIPIASNNGVARFTFPELCKSPLGPADYLHICGKYKTIFIDHIPEMSIYQKNEARRLLTFIDAAYESRCKIFCSAESEPEKLFRLLPHENTLHYFDDQLHLEMIAQIAQDMKVSKVNLASLGSITGEDEMYSFKRCISRLQEMQTLQYQIAVHRPQIFIPFTGTEQEKVSAEEKRKVRESKRRAKLQDEKKTQEGEVEETDELPLTPLMGPTTDWADEASFNTWSQEVMRKELEQKKRDVKTRQRQAPKFKDLHFWGFGWWERVVGKNKSSKTEKDT